MRYRLISHIRRQAVGYLALFIALGGTGYAAFGLPKNSVGTKQLKNRSVTSSKIKNGAVTGSKVNLGTLGTVPNATHADGADSATNATDAVHATNADQATNSDHATNSDELGGQGPGAYQQRIRWAIVSSSGTITAQSGGISIAGHDDATCSVATFNNCDYLDFGSSQAGKPINVTPTSLGTEVSAVHCGGSSPSNPGGVTCQAFDDANHIRVKAFFGSTGASEDSGYFITVIS